MAECKACEDLRNDAPDFAENGVTDAVCNSLKNDTGLDASNGHNNCTDMDNATKCLIGNMVDELERYDTCTWKDFMKIFLTNLFAILNAINCSLCGVWVNIHNIWAEIERIWAAIHAIQDEIADIWENIENILRRLGIIDNSISNLQTSITNIQSKLTKVSYLGILSLYTTTQKTSSTASTTQILAFNKNEREGNVPASVLQVTSDYKGITVHNTLGVPILVDATFNCSIHTGQRMASCYILVKRGSNAIGQTPFITPDTYDQQVMAKPFVLQPGESTTLRYEFHIGIANTWFKNEFGYMTTAEDHDDPKCRLEAMSGSGDARVQGSYFSVKVTSIVSQ